MQMSAETMDRRSTGHMSLETKHIHRRLEAWAGWVKQDMADLGLPSATYLHRWIEYGIDGARQKGQPPTMPDDVALTDAGVASLCQVDRLVLQELYLNWAPREILARRCHMRVHQFDNTVKRARWRLGFYFDQHEDAANWQRGR